MKEFVATQSFTLLHDHYTDKSVSSTAEEQRLNRLSAVNCIIGTTDHLKRQGLSLQTSQYAKLHRATLIQTVALLMRQI